LKIKTYGCRASTPMSHVAWSRYGGNTSCMTVESEGVRIIVDAGSGLMLLEDELRRQNPDCFVNLPHNILISHLHIDHIIGFGTFEPIWVKDNNMRVFTCTRDEKLSLKEQVFGIFKPPYWPSSLVDASGVKCIAVESDVPFMIEHMTILPFLANHADKTLSFRITDGKKIFVHLLDHEMGEVRDEAYEKLVKICEGADLVVFDSAYSQEDYPKFVGWGHSTVPQGVQLAKDAKLKRMLFSHFSQQYSDEEINSWARYFEGDTEFILCGDGEEIIL